MKKILLVLGLMMLGLYIAPTDAKAEVICSIEAEAVCSIEVESICSIEVVSDLNDIEEEYFGCWIVNTSCGAGNAQACSEWGWTFILSWIAYLENELC